MVETTDWSRCKLTIIGNLVLLDSRDIPLGVIGKNRPLEIVSLQPAVHVSSVYFEIDVKRNNFYMIPAAVNIPML